MPLEMPNHEPLVAAYFPAIHRGYLDLIDQYPDSQIGVLDEDILKGVDYIRKDIRSLEPSRAVELLAGIGRSVKLLGEQAITDYLEIEESKLIMPSDDISRYVVGKLIIPEDKYELVPVFLRWDRDNTSDPQPIEIDGTVLIEDTELQRILGSEMRLSPNWWRSVAAVITKNGSLITQGHNHSIPTPYSHDTLGDPRIVAQKGQNIELSTDIHAEADVITQAARQGMSLEGTEIYITTFPCQNCAKLIASSGIKTCYFVDGYATLDGLSVLKSSDVKIVKITSQLPIDDNRRYIPYSKS